MLVLGAPAWLGRLAWLAAGTFCALRQLRRASALALVRVAAQASGVRRLRCLDLPEPVVFCATASPAQGSLPVMRRHPPGGL